MPNSSPAWVRSVEVVVNVNNVPVPQQPSTEKAAGGEGRYSGSSLIYQTVTSWTVAALKTGMLKEVSMVTSDYTKTKFKLVVGGVTYMTDSVIKTALSLPFEDLSLAAGAVVILSAASTDGTAIVVDGEITAKEVG